MLRPTAKEWFKIAPRDPDVDTNDAKRWLERAQGIQRRAMYDPKSHFVRATKEGDHDFATFGQCVISIRPNRDNSALLYRCWHLRDCVWQENENGEIGFFARKWKPKLMDLMRWFGNKNARQVQDDVSKTPLREIECYHIVCEVDYADAEAKGRPYWSLYYDLAHDHVIEAIPVYNFEYVIPRWQTVSGSQYAYSPAAIIALPDARLIQAMTYTLLEAGEKAASPPIIATQNAVRSDVALYAGGLTWVDDAYDERLGDAIRPLTQDFRGLPMGNEMLRDARSMIHEAFYLSKLTLPERAPEMTAYEIGQRVQEYIRGALPLFEPMEMSYNGAVCERTFELLMRHGAFGSHYDIPPILRGADIQFRFESPLHDAIEAQKGQVFEMAKNLIAEAIALDQKSIAVIDIQTAVRDALSGIGTPATWIRDKASAADVIAAQEAAERNAQALAAMEQGSQVVSNLAMAHKNVQQAGGPPVANAVAP